MKTAVFYIIFFLPSLLVKPAEPREIIPDPVKKVEVKLDKLNQEIWQINELMKNEGL